MRTCVAIVAVAALCGCAKPEFAHRDDFDALEPYAREYVEEVLNQYFGAPSNMVVWDRLPLNQHLAQGTLVGAIQDEKNNELKLQLDLAESNGKIPAGTEMVWVEGQGSQGSFWVEAWDEIQSVATLKSSGGATPQEGARLILGPGGMLTQGRRLYAEHCMHCHGVAGDGAGPTARYLNPRPRDYRKGIFKFTSTHAAERASRDDLARIIENGIPGTYMPSFKLLDPQESDALVEYILWLSMRGETEYQLVRFLSDSFSKAAVHSRLEAAREKRRAGETDVETAKSIREEFYELANNPDEFPYELETMFDLMVSRWKSAQEESAIVVPKENRVPYSEESIARGFQLYLSPDLNCVACHGEAGFGDGPQTYSITKDIDTNEDNPKPGLYDSWGNEIVPRNLHTGVYRGGRRPIDLYDRLHAGIKGTPMPAFGAKLQDQQLWDLVNYIYSVPFQKVKAGDGAKDPAPAETNEVASSNH